MRSWLGVRLMIVWSSLACWSILLWYVLMDAVRMVDVGSVYRHTISYRVVVALIA